MTPVDRDLLLSLRRQHLSLEQTLATLKEQMEALELRAGPEESAVALPPIPPESAFPPLHPLPTVAADLPPLPAEHPIFPPVPAPTAATLPPLPASFANGPTPPAPAAAAAREPSWEFRFGRLLTRIGAVFGLIFLALMLAWPRVQALLGHAGLLALSGALSVGAILLGQRMESRGSVVVGRIITAMALGWLFLTACAATFYRPLHFIVSPILGGLLLFAWSLYALFLAARRRSPVLGLFAIVLAYMATAINPSNRFALVIDLVLAAISALFMVRRGWLAVPTFSLFATYLALLHRLTIDDYGDVVLDSSRTLHFLPHAVYLFCAWALFAVASTWTSFANFRNGRRRAFVTFNNVGFSGLLALAAYISGYGAGAVGWCLLGTGLLFLVTSRFAGQTHYDPVDLMAAYAAQGLALITGGIIIAFNGVTRAFILLLETLLLGIGGAFAGDRILTISTYVAGLFATVFLIWEMAVHAHHPWLFGFGGALVMLINAWACRGEVRHSPMARSTTVLSSSCFCLLALALVFTTLCVDWNESTLPPALALAALILTFAIYYFSIYELPAFAQLLLLAALGFVLFPGENGQELPWWSWAFVALITLLLATWWGRQRITRSAGWTHVLTSFYGLALVLLTVQTVKPFLGAQSWMIAASLLSCVFLIYGAFMRVWTLAATGQVLLAIGVYHFLFPPRHELYPWTWWAAAVALMVVYVTGRAALEWQRLFREMTDSARFAVRIIATVYLLLAALMLVRWVYAVTPAIDHPAVFFLLASLVIFFAAQRPSVFGVRCGMGLSAIGAGSYLGGLGNHALALTTFVTGASIVLFIAQPALACRHRHSLVSRLESWALVLVSVAVGWTFVSMWAALRGPTNYLTLAWSLYALFLFIFGLGLWERRLRWCAVAVLVAAIVRVFCIDLWGISTGYRVLTFFVLTILSLGLGYVIVREAERRESWL